MKVFVASLRHLFHRLFLLVALLLDATERVGMDRGDEACVVQCLVSTVLGSSDGSIGKSHLQGWGSRTFGIA